MQILCSDTERVNTLKRKTMRHSQNQHLELRNYVKSISYNNFSNEPFTKLMKTYPGICNVESDSQKILMCLKICALNFSKGLIFTLHHSIYSTYITQVYS